MAHPRPRGPSGGTLRRSAEIRAPGAPPSRTAANSIASAAAPADRPQRSSGCRYRDAASWRTRTDPNLRVRAGLFATDPSTYEQPLRMSPCSTPMMVTAPAQVERLGPGHAQKAERRQRDAPARVLDARPRQRRVAVVAALRYDVRVSTRSPTPSAASTSRSISPPSVRTRRHHERTERACPRNPALDPFPHHNKVIATSVEDRHGIRRTLDARGLMSTLTTAWRSATGHGPSRGAPVAFSPCRRLRLGARSS
jgi:hypothetical protein